MSSHPVIYHVLDGALVRRRRCELGLTEAYLGALCGVSSSVIRGLESGYSQDDLSMRFISMLTDALGVPLAALIPTEGPAAPLEATSTAAVRLGALLATAGEPVPDEAICRLLDWSFAELDAATAQLHRALEHSGQVLVDVGDAWTIAPDITSITAEQAGEAVRASYARRRPSLPELRIVHRLLHQVVTRREDLNTTRGMVIQRMRTAGVLAPHRDVTAAEADTLELSDDTRYSLMVDR